jgi:hypothetical protein
MLKLKKKQSGFHDLFLNFIICRMISCFSGVFGAGKSYLLSVVVIFLVWLFEKNDSYTPGAPFPWKLVIASTTNVAVDRILNG